MYDDTLMYVEARVPGTDHLLRALYDAHPDRHVPPGCGWQLNPILLRQAEEARARAEAAKQRQAEARAVERVPPPPKHAASGADTRLVVCSEEADGILRQLAVMRATGGVDPDIAARLTDEQAGRPPHRRCISSGRHAWLAALRQFEDETGVSRKLLLGCSKRRGVSMARHALFWAAHQYGYSQSHIGRLACRDHSTIVGSLVWSTRMLATRPGLALLALDMLSAARSARLVS